MLVSAGIKVECFFCELIGKIDNLKRRWWKKMIAKKNQYRHFRFMLEK